MSPLRLFCIGIAAAMLITAVSSAPGKEAPHFPHCSSVRQSQGPSLTFPTASAPASRQAIGEKLFLHSCAHCHGSDARGDEGPDLHGLEISDRRIATVIRQGIKGEMPAFSKKYPPPEIEALISYLRTLD